MEGIVVIEVWWVLVWWGGGQSEFLQRCLCPSAAGWNAQGKIWNSTHEVIVVTPYPQKKELMTIICAIV